MDKISEALAQLLKGEEERSKAMIPKTRQILNHLDEIEAALAQGQGRGALAEVFGWSVVVFDGALYRARKLREAGGDRRLKAKATPAEPVPAAPAAPSTATESNSLRKPL